MAVKQNEIPKGFGRIGSLALDTPIDVLDPPAPLSVAESQTVQELIETLQGYHIGCALVVDADGKLKGIVSERDILMKWALTGTPADSTSITTIMTANPSVLDSNATVAAALYMMSKGGFRHLPIVDSENRPSGIISVKDIMDYIALQFMKNIFEK